MSTANFSARRRPPLAPLSESLPVLVDWLVHGLVVDGWRVVDGARCVVDGSVYRADWALLVLLEQLEGFGVGAGGGEQRRQRHQKGHEQGGLSVVIINI